MCRPFLFSTLLLLGAVTAAPAQTPTPAETARAMLRQCQEDPARIDRAHDLLETHVAKDGAADEPTLLAPARAWFLFGEERAKTEDEKVAAYARARDYAKRATELAPRDADTHLWYAITLGSWSRSEGRYAEARQELQALPAERAPTDKPRWTLEEAPRARQMLDSIRDRQ